MPSVLALIDRGFLEYNTHVVVYENSTNSVRKYRISISNNSFWVKWWIFSSETLYLYFDENLSLIKADLVRES